MEQKEIFQNSSSDGNTCISFMVAADEGNVIGKDNHLPWHLPADMKYFKNTTWAMPVIMGRKTFESLGKPLSGRTNIVITRSDTWAFENVSVAHSITDAIAKAQELNTKEIFILGGAQVFRESLPLADRIYLTRIHHRFEGDAFFPELPAADWELVKCHSHDPDDKNKYPYSFEVWQRKEKIV